MYHFYVGVEHKLRMGSHEYQGAEPIKIGCSFIIVLLRHVTHNKPCHTAQQGDEDKGYRSIIVTNTQQLLYMHRKQYQRVVHEYNKEKVKNHEHNIDGQVLPQPLYCLNYRILLLIQNVQEFRVTDGQCFYRLSVV